MKRRILSLLLAACIMVGLLPTAAFAAEPEEALYAQMLELGLVDEYGALIEDNTFTVEDGPRLSSLDELIKWLNQCDESDLDTVITVDATGRSATVEQFMYALIIEYQMADVAGQLNLLASGENGVSLYAETGTVPTDVHNMRISMGMKRNDSILTVEVGLADKKLNETSYTAPYDITVEVGMFADFLYYDVTGFAVNGSDLPGRNCFEEFTIPAGSSSITFTMDLSVLRNSLLSLYEGLWDGNTYILFEARTVSDKSKMPDSSVSYSVSIAPSSTTDPIFSAITDGTIIGSREVNGSILPYHKDWYQNNTVNEKETIDGADYYKITIDPLVAKDSDPDDTYDGWRDLFSHALKAGVGNRNNPEINLENVTIWTKEKRELNARGLYVKDGGVLTQIATGDYRYMGDNDFADGTDAAAYLLELAKVQNTSWTDYNKNFYNQIKNHTWLLRHFQNVKLPVQLLDGEYDLSYPQDWYLKTDWIKQTDKENIRPEELLMHGAITIVDKVAPTILDVRTCANSDNFYPRNVIPIIVEFSEPVYGEYQLAYLEGTETKFLSSNSGIPYFEGDVTRSGDTLSKTRVFYYYVKSTDCTGIVVKGVKPVSNACKDVYGNVFQTNAGSGSNAYQALSAPKTLLDGRIQGGELKYSLLSMTATPKTGDPRTIDFRVELDNSGDFQTRWYAWAHPAEGTVVPEATVYVDNNNDQSVNLTLDVEGSGSSQKYFLTGTLTLPDVTTATDHVAELSFDGYYCYGIYAAFTQTPVTYADENAYTISIDGSWPSGIENTIFIQDVETPRLKCTGNSEIDYTYKYLGAADLVWKAVDPVTKEESDVVTLTTEAAAEGTVPGVTIVSAHSGTATIYLACRNNGLKTTQASKPITVTVKDSGRPTLLFPVGANTINARVNTDQTVHFVSNLSLHAPTDGKITAQLYAVRGVDENGELVLSAEPIWPEPLLLERSATSLTIPGKFLTSISRGNTASYILRLTAEADGITQGLTTDAKILVRAQPAVITLTGLDNPMFTDDESIKIGWTVKNFDLENNYDDCQFQFSIEKDGENFIVPIKDKSASGSYTLEPDTPDQLKDYYIVTAKAKNFADPTWSIASSTITVYKKGALDIQIGGEEKDSVTLKNEITGGTTTTTPSGTTYGDEPIGGLTSAEAIAKLRSELSLMESISINFQDYNWSILYDAIKWSTSTGEGSEITDELQRAVSINYRQGMLYSPLEDYSYTCYLPQTIMLLCGLRDGSNIITAQHSDLPALSDSVTVHVETLKNKLYLFQFTPAAETEVSYEDGLGKTHTVYTNKDGSLALFEPNGIASDLRAAAVSDGVSYRGTVSQLLLKSGEGNGTRGELYPLNAVELRRAAVAQVQLLQPDGKPLANTEVTLRGGVYRNRYIADNRDDAYCSGAKFAKAVGQAASLDGTKDQTFTTDANGMLTVHMDLSQFTSKNNPGAVGVGDSLEFIFELRFDDYYPEIVTVNGSLTPRDAMRSGENIVTLTDAKNQNAKPFVAVQTISYTGREIDVRRHTGVVGPSSNYPSAILDSTVMLWGIADASLADTGYRFDLRAQETGVSVPRQKRMTAKDASYPFSSIPLVNNVVTIDSSSFANFNGTRKTPLEAALYNGSGSLVSTIALPFGIADLTTIEKVDESQSVIDLLKNIAFYGSVGGKEYGYGSDKDGLMSKALSFMEQMGSKIGLVRAILTPTADPTRYEAYLWTGIDTTNLRDLDYDRNGLYVEPHYAGEDYESLLGTLRGDTFSATDFIAMADGSFFDDFDNRNKALNAALKTFVIPDMIKLEGWMSSEICYNFDKGQWQIITTGGGFTAGAQLEFAQNLNLKVYGIPLTMGFTVRGGAAVDFKTAVRYAEQLGLEWNDDTADKVNDYLTALRINAYFELFCGLGYDKGFVATYSIYGLIDINNENRFLTRKYLKNEKDRGMNGQFVQLDGEVGIRLALGVGPAVVEFNLVSLNYGDTWRYQKWDDINDYWGKASSGLSSAWLSDITMGQSLSLYNNQSAMVATEPVVKLQSRDYLDEGDRVWLGGDSGISLMSLDDPNKLEAIQTNAYPFTTPMLSDDGSILVYLSDADSTDVEDVEVRYSLTNGSDFPNGTAIPSPTGFDGYGDSNLDFDGTEKFAGAIWLREAATTGLKAGAVLDESQQTALLNGLEVVASIWDGDDEEWTTTRLTDNGSQEFNPVIAVDNNGRAIAVWRSVQTDENAFTFSQNRILYKIFDGTSWSSEYTLYNGSAGEVTGMTAEMLEDDTAAIAAIAFSVEDEIYYTVVDTKAMFPEDSAKTIRATTNAYTDENPQLTTVGDQFVLGWSSVQSLTGAEQHDVGLRVFDKNGAPQPVLPESLSDMVSTAAFDGQFTFVKDADTLDELSLLWNDANAGGEDNDVIRAIKFVNYDGSYISSAPIEVAELPERTGLNHMDARVTNGDGTSIQAVLQGTTYSEIIADDPNTEVKEPDDPTTYDKINYSYELDGKTYEGSGFIPKETVNLLSASASYSDAVEVISTTVDYTTLATDSYVPVNFTVANQGMNVIDSVTIQLDDEETQRFPGLTLLPGQTKTFSVVTKTGSEICDLDYSVEASFYGGQEPKATGTVYLDYPDVGISALTVTKEQGGLRTVLANLYNQSAASLSKSKSDRRVVLGVYSDPECETPLDGKYFTGGTEGTDYEKILTGDTLLAAIDSTGYTQEINFRIGDYVKDAGLEEIPDGGVMLFFKARIEQEVKGEWIVLPEADEQNNQKHFTFDSLLTRSENAPTTISVEMENGSTTTANVQVRNNSLQPRTSGNLVAALLDRNGNLLETRNVGKLSLGTEEVEESSIAFSKSGARVVLRYGETGSSGTPNANAANITIDGLPLTIDSFDENGNATVENVSAGQYLLTVIPEGSGATVTVNGKPAGNGMATISGGSYTRTVTVTITAADDSISRTYTIYLNPVPSQNSGSDNDTIYYTLNFETNGGSKITALRKSSGTTVDLTAYTPTRSGYIFTGWYADKALTEKITEVKLTGSTTVYAGWQEAAESPFTDVPKGSYYEEAVNWAVEQGITAGTTATTFSPNNPCTRAQAVTFLWRAAGSPTPKSSVMPFTDVAEGSYYHDAVLWAMENGITKGTSDTAFTPNAKCTRAQIVTFLWRSQKAPASDSVNPFTDVAADAYYANAVLWAAENGITGGTTATTFSPSNNCTRAQIVTFLYRCLGE